MVFAKRMALALLSALILGLYAWKPALAFVSYFCLVPWIVLYTDDRTATVSSWYYILAAYVTWMLQNNESFNFGWYAGVGMGLFYFLPWIPFAPVLSRIHERFRLPRVLTVPLVWVGVEWFRATFTLSHFDLYRLGYSQARFPILIQIADIVGMYGVSFLVAMVNGWISDVWFTLRDEGWSPAATLRRKRIRVGAVAILGTVIVFCAYGTYRVVTIRHAEGPRLAMVQPNTPHTQRNMIGVHLTQLLMTAREVEPGAADLIVWPENAILDNIRREGVYLDDLEMLARSKDAWFLVGAFGKSVEYPGKTTNGAFLIDREGRIVQSYEKQILFPWGEYIPGDRFLGTWWPALQRLHRLITRTGWGFQPSGEPGTKMEVFELPWNDQKLRFAVLICVENVYPPLPAEAGNLGAEFFVNITSEGTVGGPVQEQLLRIAMFRAVENRMSYVRVGNTGISGVIDAVGRLVGILRDDRGGTISTAGVLVTAVPLSRSDRTLYSRSSDAFVKIVVAITIGLLGMTFVPRRLGVAAVVAMVGFSSTTGCWSPPTLGTDPARVDASLSEGRTLVSEQRYARAIRPLARACATEEGCRLALEGLTVAYRNGKDDDNAVLMFGTIAERYPGLAAEALSIQGVFLDRTLDLEGAVAAYRRSVEAGPSAVAYGRLGNALMRMDRADDAIAVFRDGIAHDPDDPQLRYILGRALRIHGDLESSREVLDDLLRDHPDHGSAWTNLGRVRAELGDPEGALEAFRTALRVEPGNIEARFMLARQAMENGDLATVEEMIRQIREVEATFGRGPRTQN